MKIKEFVYIQYSDRYKSELRKLLEQLQEYIVELDTFDRVIRAEAFGEYYTDKLISNIETNGGKIFIAIDGEVVVGMIVAVILERAFEISLQIKDHKYGEIEKLFILEEYRGRGVGSELFKLAEDYLKNEQKCDFIEIVVFGDNKEAYDLYSKKGYRPREYVMLKKLV